MHICLLSMQQSTEKMKTILPFTKMAKMTQKPIPVQFRISFDTPAKIGKKSGQKHTAKVFEKIHRIFFWGGGARTLGPTVYIMACSGAQIKSCHYRYCSFLLVSGTKLTDMCFFCVTLPSVDLSNWSSFWPPLWPPTGITSRPEPGLSCSVSYTHALDTLTLQTTSELWWLSGG